MIFVSSVRPMGDDPEYDRNQLFAKASWEKVATAIVYFNEHQPQLKSPITRFLPSEKYPSLRDMVDFCADQDEWCAILNGDIVITPIFKKMEEKLKLKKAVAASSWRWQFDPSVGVDPCAHNDNGLDFFSALPGAWEMVYNKMGDTPQGDVDSARHLRFCGPRWDSWLLGTFFKLFSTMGFYNLTDARCVRHPIHGGRRYADNIPEVHFLAWPVMGQSIL